MVLLDITITITTVWLILIGLGGFFLISSIFNISKEKEKANKKYHELEGHMKELELQMKINDAESKVTYQNWALEELEKFKQTEINKIQKRAEDQYHEAALVLLQRWKIEEEAKIRQDAINRSYSVNLGKITEHLIPFHSSFLSQFNPKDARFIGSPIDLIVFDGYADKKDEIQIYIVEIKTGNSKLTEIQKKIKESVLIGNIRWAEINPEDNNQALILTSPKNQILFDFDNNNDIQKLLLTIEPKIGESRNDLIERIACVIESIGALVEDEGYTLDNAIIKKIEDFQLLFKTKIDYQIFIKSVIENFNKA